MNKNVKVKVEGKRVLSHVSAFFKGDARSILLELFQNARRAGATRITIETKEDGNLKVSNNGKPLDDFQNLFSLGGSSEYEESIQNEDPAGMGFFVASLYDKTIITTQKEGVAHTVTVTKEQLMQEGAPIEVLEIPSTERDPFTIELIGGVVISKHSIASAAFAYELPVTFNGKLCSRMDRNLLTFIGTYNGVDMYNPTVSLARVGVQYHNLIRGSVLNYHGHISTIEKENPWPELYLEPAKDCKLRLILPSRCGLVENEAQAQMKRDLIIHGYAPILAKGHQLAYSYYKKVKDLVPDFPEMAMPSGLQRAKEKGALIISNVSAQMRFLLDENGVAFYDYQDAKTQAGYSWYEPLNILRECDLQIGDPTNWGAETFSLEDLSYGVQKRGANNINNLILYKEGVEVQELEYVVVNSMDFSGYCARDTECYLGKRTRLNNEVSVREIALIIDSVVHELFEVDYDSETGSDAQISEFEEELTAKLLSEFVSKETAAVVTAEMYLKEIRYHLNLSDKTPTAIYAGPSNVQVITLGTCDSIVFPKMDMGQDAFSLKQLLDKLDPKTANSVMTAFASVLCTSPMRYDHETGLIHKDV